MKNINGSNSRIVIGLVFLISIVEISGGCSKDSSYDNGGGSGGPGANEVWIRGMAFTPATITVTAGTTIKWTNKDGVAHTVTSTTGVFDSGNIGNGGAFTFKFDVAGSYPYYCKVHPSMTATVVVN